MGPLRHDFTPPCVLMEPGMPVTHPRQFGVILRKSARTRAYVDWRSGYMERIYPRRPLNQDDHLFAVTVASHADEQALEVAGLEALGCVDGVDFVRTGPVVGVDSDRLAPCSLGLGPIDGGTDIGGCLWLSVDKGVDPWRCSLAVEDAAAIASADGATLGCEPVALPVAAPVGGRLDHVSALAFLLGHATNTDGNTFDKLMGLGDEALRAYPQAWDWLFPANAHAHPASRAPAPMDSRLRDLGCDPRSVTQLHKSCRRFLAYCGLNPDQPVRAVVKWQHDATVLWMQAPDGFDRIVARVTHCVLGANVACTPTGGDDYEWDGDEPAPFIDIVLRAFAAARNGLPVSWER